MITTTTPVCAKVCVVVCSECSLRYITFGRKENKIKTANENKTEKRKKKQQQQQQKVWILSFNNKSIRTIRAIHSDDDDYDDIDKGGNGGGDENAHDNFHLSSIRVK